MCLVENSELGGDEWRGEAAFQLDGPTSVYWRLAELRARLYWAQGTTVRAGQVAGWGSGTGVGSKHRRPQGSLL